MFYPFLSFAPTRAPLASYAILACDARTGAVGLAAQSRLFAMGAMAVCLWPGAGAVVVQGQVDPRQVRAALRQLVEGQPPEHALATALYADRHADTRQVAVIDCTGRSAVHSGVACPPWSGSLVGPGFVCQGVLQGSGATLGAMATAFAQSSGDLGERLMQALEAGQCVEGVRRWPRSAVLRVDHGSTGLPAVDLRVDDHLQPADELRRLFALYRLHTAPSVPDDLLPIDSALAYELQTILHALGYLRTPINASYDEATGDGLARLLADEQLQHRAQHGPWIDRQVLDYLRARRLRQR